MYASAVEGHKTCGSPKAATPPARAAAFIRERLLREAEDMVRLHVSRGGKAGRYERYAGLGTLLSLVPRGDIGWIYMSTAMPLSRAEARIPGK
ncbi:hypothetical protein SGFS_100780 [Streptomyces graminofaciens]|uniref:Uncharacterized protein n=1 Tax=Streptomyces graminofaciens TaxID=68212 RepID=A0ABN5VZD3_9ACTN|nr:hypothetical protein SGFS_100780 [Streptomyces graminofaciens]